MYLRASLPLGISSHDTLWLFSADAMDEEEIIHLSRNPCDDEMGTTAPKIKKTTTVESMNGLKGNTVSTLRTHT